MATKIIQDNLDFGQAIKALKESKFVQRKGWNGKNMHLYLEDRYIYPIKTGFFKGEDRTYESVICMFTAQKTHQPGWLASQADMLAEDWRIIECS
jgi:hypothetical protein